MNKEKIHLKTIFLLGLIVILVGGIFYLSVQLTNSPGSAKLPIQRVKTKAAAKDYTKLIALNDISPTTISSSDLVSPSPSTSPSLSPSPSSSLPSLSPTPTDIVVAKNNLSPSGEEEVSSAEGTILPTRIVSQLPASGYTGYTLAIFGAALMMILFAFVL